MPTITVGVAWLRGYGGADRIGDIHITTHKSEQVMPLFMQWANWNRRMTYIPKGNGWLRNRTKDKTGFLPAIKGICTVLASLRILKR